MLIPPAASSKEDRDEYADSAVNQGAGDHHFTTILSMHADKRGPILSALREIYDGKWFRTVGPDGGQRLEWVGKLGLLTCCTTTYDRTRGVIATTGDRFVLLHLDDGERIDGTVAALGSTGADRLARVEIVEAAAGLLGPPRLPRWRRPKRS